MLHPDFLHTLQRINRCSNRSFRACAVKACNSVLYFLCANMKQINHLGISERRHVALYKTPQLYLQYRLPRKPWLVWPINVIYATTMFVNHLWGFSIVYLFQPDVWSHIDGLPTKVLIFHKDKFWSRFGLDFLFSLSFLDSSFESFCFNEICRTICLREWWSYKKQVFKSFTVNPLIHLFQNHKATMHNYYLFFLFVE